MTHEPSVRRKVEECQKMVEKSLKNPKVKFLREQLEKAGCAVKDSFIRSVYCDARASGFYDRSHGIVVCGNHLKIQDNVTQVVIHELIHAYDDCRAKNMNWSNCEHHTCAEIRANNLSGDCHYLRELLRGHGKFKGHQQDCIKRRVMMSMAANRNCPEKASKEAMEAVWDICYNDIQPFDRVL